MDLPLPPPPHANPPPQSEQPALPPTPPYIPYSSPQSVTLFINGHGNESLDKEIDLGPNVRLLSFVGVPGGLGRMGICVNGRTIEDNVLQYLREHYLHNIKNNWLTQHDILRDPLTREQLNQYYIQFLGHNFGKKGFSITYPRAERTFFWKPMEHENCRDDKCIRHGTSGQGVGCVKGRKEICHDYGITVVASTNIFDDRFTLTTARTDNKGLKYLLDGDPKSDEERIGEYIRGQSTINLNEAVFNHWRARATRESPSQTERINFIFNKIAPFYDKNSPRSIKLSELVEVFQYMGFGEINILDPSCRTFVPQTDSTVYDFAKIHEIAKKRRRIERKPPKGGNTTQKKSTNSKKTMKKKQRKNKTMRRRPAHGVRMR